MKEDGRPGLRKACTAEPVTGKPDTHPSRVLLQGVPDGTDDGRMPHRKCLWGEARRDDERAQEKRPAGQPIAGTGPICAASTDSRVQRYENLLHNGIPINGDYANAPYPYATVNNYRTNSDDLFAIYLFGIQVDMGSFEKLADIC